MATGQRSKSPQGTLRDEIRDALLAIVRDAAAPATARAHAARSLVLMLGQDDGAGDRKPAAEMTIDELDAEIAGLQQPQR